VTLSVVIIAHNEEANIGRTLASLQPLVTDGRGEIIVVDSGSIDRTVEIAKSLGAKVFVEEWKGYSAQKNSAMEKATGEWILSLDADEELETNLASEIAKLVTESNPAERSTNWCLTVETTTPNPGSIKGPPEGYLISRKNFFLDRWIRHGGFWPDPKLRLFRRGAARFEDRGVHEDAILAQGSPGRLRGALLHHSYPTLEDYIDHINRYSSLGAEMAIAKNSTGFGVVDIVIRPAVTFIYNYLFRLGFLDGREGLLLHLYHAVYVSWKYSKAWELSTKKTSM
jgi:glycosyltransferase involved in cell wall biosynthesis